MNIVLLDDEPRIVKGLKKLISSMDERFQVIEAFTDAVRCKEYLMENGKNVDLFITDIKMPSVTGLELLESPEVITKDTAVVILTGYDYFDYAKRAIKLGVEDYLLKPVDPDELKAILDKILKSKYGAGEGLSQLVLKVKTDIETHFRDFDVEAEAEKMHFSRDYLSRVFKKEMGITIGEYLLRIRMEKAKSLLSEPGRYKIYEVCELAGYNDKVHFSKTFKRYFGITPKEFQMHYSGENTSETDKK